MDRVLNALTEIVEAGRGVPDADAVHAAERMIVDSLGCALGSFREPVSEIVRTVASRRHLEDGSPVFGTGLRAQPDQAAFANSVMIRFLDYNDTYGSVSGVGHPSDYIPAATVSLHGRKVSGDAALRGILVGYEVFCRLTDATRLGVEQIDHVLSGAVASAAAVAVSNGLSAEQTREALSLAVTANLSLQATRLGNLSMWKGCAAGNACRNGVFAAELALLGMSGPEAPFEGRGGLTQVTGREPDMSALEAWEEPAIRRCHVKRYPSGYFSQGAVEAAVDVRGRLVDAASSSPIASVRVGTFEFGRKVMSGDQQKWHPTTRETADHSIPYVVACALARGRVGHHDLDVSQLDSPDIRAILDVLKVEEDAECVAAWPEACMNKVTVTLADGVQEAQTVRYYRGHAKNPLSDQELEDKFREQAEHLVSEESSEELLHQIWNLHDAESPDRIFGWTVPTDLAAASAHPAMEGSR